jgi:hypothetical protein
MPFFVPPCIGLIELPCSQTEVAGEQHEYYLPGLHWRTHYSRFLSLFKPGAGAWSGTASLDAIHAKPDKAEFVWIENVCCETFQSQKKYKKKGPGCQEGAFPFYGHEIIDKNWSIRVYFFLKLKRFRQAFKILHAINGPDLRQSSRSNLSTRAEKFSGRDTWM